MNLRIYPPDGLVKVSAPKSYSDRFIKQQIKQKADWIREQQERIRTRHVPQETGLVTGSTLPFKGTSFLLVVEEHNGPSQITINDSLIHLYAPHNATDAQKQKILDQWYKQQMESLIPALIDHWARIIGVQVAEWGIKKMKTRWGSCNTRAHRIWLNLNLIKKPVLCLEYVLVHELVHLLEASHNKRFYALMTQFMPQWKEHQQALESRS